MTAIANRIHPEDASFGQGGLAAGNSEDAIYAAVATVDWTALPGWQAFDSIADSAEPDSLVVYAEAASDDGRHVRVPIDLSVELHYHANAPSDEADAFPDSFPATLTLERQGGTLRVVAIDVVLLREAD